jgi:hypothetical protein
VAPRDETAGLIEKQSSLRGDRGAVRRGYRFKPGAEAGLLDLNIVPVRPVPPVLLGQPDGFEGLIVVAVVLDMGYEPVSEGRHDRSGHVDLYAAAPSRDAEGPECQYPVSEIANVGEVKTARPIVLDKVRKPLSQALVPHVASLKRGLLRLEADVGVVEPEPAPHRSSVQRRRCPGKTVERLGALGKSIDVPPRHRLLSIARARTASNRRGSVPRLSPTQGRAAGAWGPRSGNPAGRLAARLTLVA